MFTHSFCQLKSKKLFFQLLAMKAKAYRDALTSTHKLLILHRVVKLDLLKGYTKDAFQIFF